MNVPARRTVAYLLLWLVLAGVILWRRQAAPIRVEPGDDPGVAFVIRLNQDPWHRLTLIEGIGETLARRIVRTREEEGPFQSLEEVKALPGVPDRAIEAARDYLSLD